MKKLLLVAMASVMALGASAQIMTSRTMVKSKKPTIWYARVGLSLNNAAGGNEVFEDDDDNFSASIKPKAGMSIDFGFQRPISKGGLYWGMELGIGTRGGAYSTEYTSKDYNDEEVRETENSSLLTWNIKYSPFTFGYKYSLTDDIKIDAHIGIFASYDFAGSAKTKFEYNSGSEDSESLSISELEDEFDFQSLDAGLQLGAGIWYKKFNVDLTWQKGFIPAASVYNGSDDYDLTSSNFMIRLGYAF